jgi:tellurite methyltransferase
MSPSTFVAGWIPTLAARIEPPRRALDLAIGGGRHTLLLARYGFRTFGVDMRQESVRDVVAAAALNGLVVHGWCADLTISPLPVETFDLVVVTRYLQRNLFTSIQNAVKPGGFVLYETFTVAQRLLGSGPTSADHLLEPGELRDRFSGWDVLFYEEVASPEAVARLAAQRSFSA